MGDRPSRGQPGRFAQLRSQLEGVGVRAGLVLFAASALMVASAAHRRTLAGTLASLALAALIGALVVAWLPRVAKAVPKMDVPRAVRALLAPALVLAVAAFVFVDPRARDWDFEKGDWAIHVYLAEELAAALDRGRIPAYLHGFNTGDSPFELYPLATHWLTAQLARVFDMRDQVPDVMGWLGVGGFVLLAVGVARLASRMAPWPLAALAGALVLLDAGELFAGGAIATLYYALLDQTLALVLGVFGVGALADWLARPAWHRAVRVWILFALLGVTHPSGLLVAGAVLAALLVVAILARDVRPLVSLTGAMHVAIGLMASAIVWSPYAGRVLDWGASYPNSPIEASRALAELLAGALPKSSYPAFVLAGFAGVVVGVLSRRAVPTLVASVAALLIAGYFDIPYVLSSIVPSEETARIAAFRLPALAKPFIFALVAVLGAFLLPRSVNWGTRSKSTAGRHRLALGAVAGVAVLLLARAIVPFAADRVWEVRNATQGEVHDREGLDELVAWAKARAEEQPGRFGRMFFESTDHYSQAVGSRTGLPVFHQGAVPMAFLRERMTDTTPDSLRRFGVRWVVKRGGPPAAGDRLSQIRFGTYHVRFVSVWDGRFAHIERGEGRVHVRNLEDDRVVVELTDTDEPALVSFAMGYYPRWRATHEGRAVPVYGLTASENGESEIVAVWIPPGRTVLTADAPLPSDTRGRRPALLALLLAASFLIASLVPPLRRRARRVLARGSLQVRAHRGPVAIGALVVLALGLLVAGAGHREEPADAITVFDGFSSGARIEAKHEDLDVDPVPIKIPFTPCERIGWAGYADCGRAGRVGGTMSSLVGHEVFSWPWAAPAIVFTPRSEPAHFEVEMVRTLAGTYQAASFGERATFRITLDDDREITVGRVITEIELPETPRAYRLKIEVTTTTLKPAFIGMVRPKAIGWEQDIPEPPESPPADLMR